MRVEGRYLYRFASPGDAVQEASVSWGLLRECRAFPGRPVGGIAAGVAWGGKRPRSGPAANPVA